MNRRGRLITALMLATGLGVGNAVVERDWTLDLGKQPTNLKQRPADPKARKGA